MATIYGYYAFSVSNTPSSWGDARVEVDYSYSTNNAGNYTDITATQYVRVSGNALDFGSNQHLVVAGNQTTKSQWMGGLSVGRHWIQSQTRRVNHDAQGAGGAYVQGRIQLLEGGVIGQSTTNNTWVQFPTIPRGTTISTFTLSGATLSTINVSWSTAHNINLIQYQVGSGSWINGESGINKQSGSFTISGLNPGTSYSIKIRVRRADTSVETTSSAKSLSTLNIARFVSVPDNIDIEQPFAVTFNRNAASKVEVCIYYDGVYYAPYREVESGDEYTFTLTSAEKNAIYNAAKTTNEITLNIFIATNDNAFRESVSRKFKITNANPIFTNFDYYDGNTNTAALTGNNKKFIEGHSDLIIQIQPEQRAIAVKEANMLSYSLSMEGHDTQTQNWSKTETVQFNLNQIKKDVFTLTALDSRQNTTAIQTDLGVNFIPYNKPTVSNFKAERVGGVEEEVKLSFNGTWCDCDFGAEQNSLSAEYWYREPNKITWTEATLNHGWQSESVVDGNRGQIVIPYPKNFTMGLYDSIRVKLDDNSYHIGTIVRVYDYASLFTSYELSFSTVISNGFKNITAVYTNTAWAKGTTAIPITVNGNNVSVSDLSIAGDLPLGFTANKGFDIRLELSDKVDKVVQTYDLLSATPALAIHRNGVSAGAPYDTDLGGALQVGGDTYIDKDIEVGGALIVDGDAYMAGVLQVNGAAFSNGSQILTRADIVTYNYILSPFGTNYAVGGWRTMAYNYTTGVIPAGTYLMIFKFTFSSTQPSIGLATARAVIDGAEISPQTRATIPTCAATISGIITAQVTFSTDATHILNGHAYPFYQAVTNGTQLLSYSFIRLK